MPYEKAWPQLKAGTYQGPKLLYQREITLPDSDYQPRQAEKEEEMDMPSASRETVRRSFFRPFKIRRDRTE